MSHAVCHGSSRSTQASSYGVGGAASTLTGRVLETLAQWQARITQRTRLAKLDDHLLKDLGLTRSEALQEADKPFWRP